MIQCEVCDVSFQRQEHLTRHLRIHTSEKPFACPTCGKAFSRQDVLSRHIATHDQSSGESPGPYARACRECAASRVRCSRGDPCGRCVSRELQCDYPMARKRKASSSGDAIPEEDRGDIGASVTRQYNPEQGEFADTISRPLGVTHIDVLSQDPRHPFNDMETAVLGDRPSFPSSAMGIASQAGWIPVGGTSHRPPVIDLGTLEDGGTADPYTFPPPATYQSQTIGLSSINWMSPEDQSMLDWAGQLALFTSDNTAFDSMGPQDLFGVQEQLQGNSNASTDEFCSSYGPRLPQSPTQRHPRQPDAADEHASAPTDGTKDSTPSTSTERRFYVEGAGARAPFRGRATHGPSSVTAVSALSDSVNEHIIPSAAPSSDVISANNLVSITSYENLLRGLRAEGWQPPPAVDMGGFPSISQVRLFVRLYFEYFHPTLPFLRRGTSLPERPEDWVLLLVIVTMGTRYAPGKQNLTIRGTLLDLSQTVLLRRFNGPAKDDHKLWVPGLDDLHSPLVDLPTLQAGVLHLINMLHAGTRFHMNQGLMERQRLVQACLSMDLLGPGGCAHGVDEPQDGLVRDWLVQQERIRTGLTIWLLDSVIAFQFGCPPLMKLGDATVELPCREDVWDHPTVENIIRERSQSVALLEAVEILYLEKKLPPRLSEFATQVLIYSIYRRTKEANYQLQTTLSSWTPSASIQKRSKTEIAEESWPPSRPILSKWRNIACDCLDILHWDANSIAATAAGWEHPTIMHLHLARLLILTPTQHIQTFSRAFANNSSNGSLNHAKLARSRYHVLQWALRDQYKARLAIIHAGALLWHVRRYSSNSFLEPFSIYIATLVIWTYSTTMQSVRRQTGPATRATDVRSGDDGSAHGSPQDPEPSFIHLDRPCDDEMVQTYVRFGDKMSAHMSRVGNIMEPEALRRILREGRRLMIGRDTPPRSSQTNDLGEMEGEGIPVWGIERSYADLLVRLIQRSNSGG
ncbi:hypothetical protein F5X68DRAFT_127651 [Plectosphaerella plurivora]|uniref:Uncharacterized protein n=1 Tax=Plectosphaerella plurivora TaxID=936078 RepID=A0A9P8VJ31_9PEZI|nr:hypothetical protein F5X68DRAFT_127651 [Plectosphaerella plurivora]